MGYTVLGGSFFNFGDAILGALEPPWTTHINSGPLLRKLTPSCSDAAWNAFSSTQRSGFEPQTFRSVQSNPQPTVRRKEGLGLNLLQNGVQYMHMCMGMCR